jgi:LysR family transcriptional regulator, chromosome initiation inhibitor
MSLSNLGLDAFEVTAQEGTLVKASKILGVTQTALTQRVKLLEEQVGRPLFIRSRKGMELTSEGQLLFSYCISRKRLEHMTLTQMSGAGLHQPYRLRISGPTLQTQKRLFQTVRLLKKKHPELYVSFDCDDSGNLLDKLKNNQSDVILTSLPEAQAFPHKKLSPSSFILVGTAKWNKRSIEDIISNESSIDFNQHDQYTLNFLNKFKLRPGHLKERHFINNTLQMLDLIELGLGYAVFDQSHVEKSIQDKRLVNLTPRLSQKIDWYLCWNETGSLMNPIIENLIQEVN